MGSASNEAGRTGSGVSPVLFWSSPFPLHGTHHVGRAVRTGVVRRVTECANDGEGPGSIRRIGRRRQ